MIQWKQTKVNRLKSHAEDLSNKSRTEINNLKEELRIEQIQIHERTRHENEINELARTLSKKMRGEKPQDDVMEQEFNSMWITWLNKLTQKLQMRYCQLMNKLEVSCVRNIHQTWHSSRVTMVIVHVVVIPK